MISHRTRVGILAAICVAAVVATAFVPPIPQPSAYHSFADTRIFFGIPNFWNVVSNVPFFFVGAIGLGVVVAKSYTGGLDSLRVAYGVFFAGIALVCFGSGYYHWSPSNETLMWDRLPMAVAFMAILAALIGEHIDVRVGRGLLWPLLAIGVVSVLYWNYTESIGRGDLRLYGLVQFLSLVIVVLLLTMFPSKLSGTGYLWAMFAGYAIAKLLEEFDREVFAFLGNRMSGHALKHVAAAIGMYAFVLALRRRKRIEVR